MQCLPRALLQSTWSTVPQASVLAASATGALLQLTAGAEQSLIQLVSSDPVYVLASRLAPTCLLRPYSSTPATSNIKPPASVRRQEQTRDGGKEASTSTSVNGVLHSRINPKMDWSMSQQERMKSIRRMREPGETEIFDPLEFMLWLKEKFMKQEIGLPDGTRELIFSHHWDKALVDVRRTVKVTKSTKLETYHAIACVGNFEGFFGVGIASNNNSQHVVGEAYIKAYQNLVPIPLYRNHTVYHRIEHKFHTIKMIIMPRPEGYGVVASPVLRELCNMIGIKNISIKVYGRRGRKNKFDLVKCFLEAVQKQSAPHHGIEGTGVYAREVYYKPHLPFGLHANQLLP